MSKGPLIMPADLPESILGRPAEVIQTHESLSLKQTEKDLILKTLRDCHGNKHLTAKILRIPRSTLYSKIQKHGIILDGYKGTPSNERESDSEKEQLTVQNQTGY
jgi:transcriptional regulator of acetoin/glycerol metabolism